MPGARSRLAARLANDMSRNLPVIVVGAILLLIAGGVTFMVKRYGPGSPNDTADAELEQLARTNPSLEISKRLEDSSNRVPAFWIKETGSGREVLMPRSLADDGNATVEFTSCASAPIPPRLLPPTASTPVCMLITSGGHKLNAFYFSAKGRVSDMQAFYDGPSTGRHRSSFHWEEESMRQAALPDGKIGFAYSYYLYGYGSGTDFSVAGLVGYRRDGIP